MNWKILLNGKTDARNFSCSADVQIYTQCVGRAETTEPTACNKRQGFNFMYVP